jgi:hypothetical protein
MQAGLADHGFLAAQAGLGDSSASYAADPSKKSFLVL